MKNQAISGLPVSVVFYTETGLQDPQKLSPKQGISRIITDTKADNSTYVVFHFNTSERPARNPQVFICSGVPSIRYWSLPSLSLAGSRRLSESAKRDRRSIRFNTYQGQG